MLYIQVPCGGDVVVDEVEEKALISNGSRSCFVGDVLISVLLFTGEGEIAVAAEGLCERHGC